MATFSSSAIGPAAGSLLAGTFGDGRINVLAKHDARYVHQVTSQVRDTSTSKPFTEPGLRGLLPGTATTGGTDALRFTAGINYEQNGLRASSPVTPVQRTTPASCDTGDRAGPGTWRFPGPVRAENLVHVMRAGGTR